MNNIRPGDLAFVVEGLWPNVGRVVFVSSFQPNFDFSSMGLGTRDGWRVRSWSDGPLETTDGLRMSAITPVGSLRRLERFPAKQQREIVVEMAEADFKEAMVELARCFEMEEAQEKVLEET